MTPHSEVPTIRIRKINEAAVRDDGDFVLYWMTSNRRAGWNFSLQRAVDWSRDLQRPLLVLEPLRLDYPWASARFHRFLLDGMADNHRRFDAAGVAYYPYVAPEVGADRRVFAGLAAQSAIVVADDNPMFFYPRMLRAAAAQLSVPVEAVDSSGLLPQRATDRDYPTAYAFRRFLQKELPEHLDQLPLSDPIGDASLDHGPLSPDSLVPGAAPTPLDDLESAAFLADLPVDQTVAPLGVVGGEAAGRVRLERFVAEQLPAYAERRNHPERDYTSRLSAYLHFGHLSAHEIFATVAAEDAWTPASLATTTSGARSGWWGVGESAEAFLDQLITWRELGFNMCVHRDDYAAYTSLPSWALTTLDEHRDDERPYLYDLATFEAAATHDEIWNAAQTQLVEEGLIHNYLRMLWGKKILEWSATPEEALAIMIELNNKYALDGRDPNSYSGIFWVMGRYDRAWGPERPVVGKVRYMTSANTARKLRFGDYLERFGAIDARQAELPC